MKSKALTLLIASGIVIIGGMVSGCLGQPPLSAPLKDVKVAIVYERLNDDRPRRSIEEQIRILKETKTDLIFRASWRWQPLAGSCSELPPFLVEQAKKTGYSLEQLREVCEQSGYTFEQTSAVIQRIKKEKPGIIIVGAVPAQKINKVEFNELTGATLGEEQTWQIALDPAKWGIESPTKDQLQKMFPEPITGGGHYPDITNPLYQELVLSWAKRQLDSGMDAIWIDLLYTQVTILARVADIRDENHPALKESYNAASKVVDEIHNYGKSKGRYVHVGTWDAPATEFANKQGYQLPKLDFVTVTPTSQEVSNRRLDEKMWEDKIAKIRSVFGKDIPILAFIDWSGDDGQLARFSQTRNEDQSEFLKTADDFFTKKGVIFVYPVHGGIAHSSVTIYGKHSKWYDALAPEFQTYDTIKELAQRK